MHSRICQLSQKPIIIHASGLTIWQAVLRLDPTFPKEDRLVDIDDRVVREWERIPTPYEVAKAIKLSKETL